MGIRQFSVFIANTPGSLEKVAALLSDNGVDLVSVSLADTTHFGILRAIATDHEKAVSVLEENGYTVKTNHVLVVSLPDQPGGFSRVLSLLAGSGISVEYLYSCVRSAEGNARIVFRVDSIGLAAEILTGAGIRLLSEEDMVK